MLVQWNLVLRAEGKCPLATRCAQNLESDDKPACLRPENHNVHMIPCLGVTQTRQSYSYETNDDVYFLSHHFKRKNMSSKHHNPQFLYS